MVSVSNTGLVESSELAASIVKLKNKGGKIASAQRKRQPLAYRTTIKPSPPPPPPTPPIARDSLCPRLAKKHKERKIIVIK